MDSDWPEIPGYEILAEIGRGGMGIVYRARQRVGDRTTALKMLLGSRGASFVELARFRVEIEALACLSHPNIVKIREVGLHSGAPYFAMDFAERGSLKQAIAAGRQSPRASAELVRVLAGAMQHAHERKMLHRDLKPANVLLTQDGTPVISDFGLVKFTASIREVSDNWCTTAQPEALDIMLNSMGNLDRELAAQYGPDSVSGFTEEEVTRSVWQQCASRTGLLEQAVGLSSVRGFLGKFKKQSPLPLPDLDELTISGVVLGSPKYMAPEQAAGDLSAIGPPTDVYALGCILYELLAGRPPFQGDRLLDLMSQTRYSPPIPPRQFAPDLSVDIESVCLKCLEKSPSSRYQTAAELAEDLARFLEGYTPCLAAPKVRAELGPSPKIGDRASTINQGAPTLLDRPAATKNWWLFGSNRSKRRG